MGAKRKGKLALAAVLDTNVHILGQRKPRVVKPMHDWHILKEIPGPTHSAGGIEIPENKRVAECEIVSSGPGRVNPAGNLEPMSGKIGQRVLFETTAKPCGIVDGVIIYAIRDVFLIGSVERNPDDVEPAPSAIEKLAAETGLVIP